MASLCSVKVHIEPSHSHADKQVAAVSPQMDAMADMNAALQSEIEHVQRKRDGIAGYLLRV